MSVKSFVSSRRSSFLVVTYFTSRHDGEQVRKRRPFSGEATDGITCFVNRFEPVDVIYLQGRVIKIKFLQAILYRRLQGLRIILIYRMRLRRTLDITDTHVNIKFICIYIYIYCIIRALVTCLAYLDYGVTLCKITSRMAHIYRYDNSRVSRLPGILRYCLPLSLWPFLSFLRKKNKIKKTFIAIVMSRKRMYECMALKCSGGAKHSHGRLNSGDSRLAESKFSRFSSHEISRLI
ncbi:hypothetical protein PUN28_000364 [Cardiocondyla obscurior]|uniref:Uncharacterized protein n=1 Tax=Cardiocondyla obscurior TaxID=286306 RepID=A0AAW2GZJ0_9HYME